MRRVDPGAADSAGVPWKGRDLKPSPFSGDSGHADPHLSATLKEWQAGTVPLSAVVAALAGTRVIIPVMAEVENLVVNEATDLVADKDASTGVVCVSAPDGRIALPIFTSVPEMTKWNKNSRPIPVEAERAALAAVSEEWPLLVINPGSSQPVIIPRPAVWALAQGKAAEWIPAPNDTELAREVNELLTQIPAVQHVELQPGKQAETAIILRLQPGLDQPGLQQVLQRVQSHLGQSVAVAEKIDSVELRVT